MSRIEEGIEIYCPVEKAFAFTTNAGNWNKWQVIIPEAEQTSPGPRVLVPPSEVPTA